MRSRGAERELFGEYDEIEIPPVNPHERLRGQFSDAFKLAVS